MKRQWTIFASLLAIFLIAYFLNLSSPTIQEAILEAFRMLQWYARNHTLACVVPAMFIAGGIATFLSKEAVLRHLGPKANKLGAYTVASVSGTVLAVCSCSVLPMFAGIYRVGAGLGPASAFLYSGPAINVMAIFLTARVLGFDIGLARVIGAVGFAYLIGLLMAVIFRREEQVREAAMMQLPDPPAPRRTLLQTSLYFASMILFLVFSDWADPSETVLHFKDGSQRVVSVLEETTDKYRIQYSEQAGDRKVTKKEWIEKGTLADDRADRGREQRLREGYEWAGTIYSLRWYFAGACFLALLAMLWRWFGREEIGEWMGQTWGFAKTIIPLLFGGVFITGFVSELLPEKAVAAWVGGNGIVANFMASLIGAMWYFATLTEIPIIEALRGLGMGMGPQLALLLAGPALSVPSIAVIYQVIGLKKTAVFVTLVVVFSTIAGMIFGAFYGG